MKRDKKKTYAIYVSDDNGWLDGCPDRETVFFGGQDKIFEQGDEAYGGIAHIEIVGYREALSRLRDLNTTGDWINPYGKEIRPTYRVRECTA